MPRRTCGLISGVCSAAALMHGGAGQRAAGTAPTRLVYCCPRLLATGSMNRRHLLLLIHLFVESACVAHVL